MVNIRLIGIGYFGAVIVLVDNSVLIQIATEYPCLGRFNDVISPLCNAVTG